MTVSFEERKATLLFPSGNEVDLKLTKNTASSYSKILTGTIFPFL